MFNTFVGQSGPRQLLSEAVRYSQITGKRVPHLLLYSGFGGSGKSLLIRLLADELKCKLITINAIDSKPIHIAEAVASSKEQKIIRIEEYNKRNPELDMFLRSFMEENRVLINGQEYQASPWIDQTTIAILSNNKSVFPQPLLSRLYVIKMQQYSDNELLEIAKYHYDRLKKLENHPCEISLDGLSEMASRSKGIPRRIVKGLESCVRRAVVKGSRLGREEVIDVMETMGVFKYGLDLLDIQLMEALVEYEALSLSALSGLLGEPTDVVRLAEANLIGLGTISITNKRRITMRGRELLEDIKQ